MMHHLAVSNKGYNLLNEVVTHGMRNTALFDSVLAEVAEYVDPDLKSHGHYKLRKHCWAKFDPLFLHFQGHELQVGSLDMRLLYVFLGGLTAPPLTPACPRRPWSVPRPPGSTGRGCISTPRTPCLPTCKGL